MSERLQKFLARAGVASRRHAEGLITAGRVQVNNQRITELGTKVEPSDLVTVDGVLVTAPETTSWYLLNKPPGVVTTLSDPEGRPTVMELLREVPTRVFPVGRLDWDAEGALLFTNDGAAAHRLLHPSFEVRRTYLVKVKGAPTEQTLQRLCEGVRLEDGPARALRAKRFEAAERNTWLVLEVGEGRPHLVKRLCAAIGHPVLRLFRPAQGGISVAGMGAGEVRPLTSEEVARVQSVASGMPVPEPALFLPPRRHGRPGDLEEAGGEEAARPGSAPPAAPPGAARRGGDRFGGAQRQGRTGRAPGDFKRPPGRGKGRPPGAAAAAAGSQLGRRFGAPPGRRFPGTDRAGGAPGGPPFGARPVRRSAPAGKGFEPAAEGQYRQRFGKTDRAGEGAHRVAKPFGAPRGRSNAPPGQRGFDRGRDPSRAARGPHGRPGGRDGERRSGAPGRLDSTPPNKRGGSHRGGRSGHWFGARERGGEPSSEERRGVPRWPRHGERRGGRFGALPRQRGRGGGMDSANAGPPSRRGQTGPFADRARSPGDPRATDADRPHERGRRPPGRPGSFGGRGRTHPGSGRRPPPRR